MKLLSMFSSIFYTKYSEEFKYPESNVLLNQYIVIDNNSNLDVYHIWDHAYSIDSISRLLDRNDFDDLEFYGDLTGGEYRQDSKTLGIIARKLRRDFV